MSFFLKKYIFNLLAEHFKFWVFLCLFSALVGSFPAWSLQDEQTLQLTPTQYQQIEKFYGKAASDRVKTWMLMLKNTKNLPEDMKLSKVNQFFNRLQFISDEEHWNKEDYWATPLEMLITNGGDCEDFSVAKYFSLLQLNVDMSKLRLTYVKALKLNQAHMVLSYFAEGQEQPLVLDNLIDGIEPASKRTDLEPLYSFNGEDLWLSKERARGQWIGKSTKISLWRDLIERFNQTIDKQIVWNHKADDKATESSTAKQPTKVISEKNRSKQ